jgi:hypothetical protein
MRMKCGIRFATFVLCTGLVWAGIALSGDAPAHAAAKVVKIEGADLSAARSMAENLAAFKGRSVTVVLGTGETIIGKVVDVNSRYLHLTDLERSNFYDAIIDLNHVGAVKAQVRKYGND